MTITLTPEQEEALREAAARQNKTPEQVTQEALLEALNAWHTPQSLEELRPRKPLASGKMLRDVLNELGPWPGNETDAELQAALKARDND